ncbi:ribosome-associated protein [Salsuginibacillus halophilus]|uniref:Ribosomal silencing factor RsfS n=1 Tax=Salsuginibacillus halophilus TaxID=517424 RepID=A0A2P8HFS9_9BACI|nr:ribosome silencing factor [Salsuginibacillus halophilus]PSL45053.1 ribosome-associated protein [Salsuginibacillus halophilus]
MEPKEILKLAVDAADDKKAKSITALNMQGVSLLADYFVICHGSSAKQVQAIAREIKDQAHLSDLNVQRMEGFDDAKWVLIDLDDVVVHVFNEDERYYYNLEKLWGDAKEMEVQNV